MEEPEGDSTPEAILDSLVKVEVLSFFAANPDALDSVGGIALRLGYMEGLLIEPLEQLADAGVLRRAGTGPTIVYRLGSGPVVRDVITLVALPARRSELTSRLAAEQGVRAP